MIESRCPSCGLVNTVAERTAADAQPALPAAGDWSVCWGCGAVGIFTADGGLRRPTPEEAAEVEADPEVRRIRGVMAIYGRRR